MKRLVRACGLSAVLVAGASQAATTSTTFAVSATVLDACTVVAAPLAFGNFNPIGGANNDATTTVGVLCTYGTGYTIRLNTGANGTLVTARKMLRATGTELMGYALYRDSNRSLNWGQTDGTDTVAGTGSGVLQNVTVYGRIPSTENTPAGTYADLVTVTLNY